MSYNMYGISQNPFGKISTLYVKDILEHAMVESSNRGTIDEFVSTSSSINKAIKSLETEMASPVREKEPQSVGGALFRVKRKGTSYRGKYM